MTFKCSFFYVRYWHSSHIIIIILSFCLFFSEKSEQWTVLDLMTVKMTTEFDAKVPPFFIIQYTWIELMCFFSVSLLPSNSIMLFSLFTYSYKKEGRCVKEMREAGSLAGVLPFLVQFNRIPEDALLLLSFSTSNQQAVRQQTEKKRNGCFIQSFQQACYTKLGRVSDISDFQHLFFSSSLEKKKIDIIYK